MGLFGGGNSSSSTTTINHDDDLNAANYGNGLQIFGSEQAVIDVNYLSEGVAKAAIAEAGMFAETAANFSSDMQKSNNQLVKSVLGAMSGSVESAISAAGGQSAKNEKMVRIITFASVGTIAVVLMLGAYKK